MNLLAISDCCPLRRSQSLAGKEVSTMNKKDELCSLNTSLSPDLEGASMSIEDVISEMEERDEMFCCGYACGADACGLAL